MGAHTAAGARLGSALATRGYLGTLFFGRFRVRESLLVGPCFINHVSTLMLGNLPNIRRKMCAAKMFDHY
jgi:hypothetical protein